MQFWTRLALFACLWASTAAGQTASRLAVAVDCAGFVPGCDLAYVQTETPWVAFVRDPSDADVSVLVTAQPTGGGGIRYELTLDGRRGALAGRRDTLAALSPPAASEDAQRRALTARLHLGLVGFALRTGGADGLTLRYEAPAGGAAVAADDPWRAWIFRASAGGFASGQRQVAQGNVNASLSANRVTDAWKWTARLFGRYSRNRFTLSDGEALTVSNTSVGGLGIAVKTLSPRTAAGVYGFAERSTFQNYDLRVEIAPGVEANLYPYAESTRRQLRVQYEAGAEMAMYADTTIFGRLREVNPFHELEVKAVFAQPWGTADVGTEFNQLLSQPEKYRAELSGNASLRVLRGLSLDVGGRAALVRNQINLVRGDASDEDVLTQQRELATGYEFFASVGLSYTFGSVFNPVVNVRFD